MSALRVAIATKRWEGKAVHVRPAATLLRSVNATTPSFNKIGYLPLLPSMSVNSSTESIVARRSMACCRSRLSPNPVVRMLKSMLELELGLSAGAPLGFFDDAEENRHLTTFTRTRVPSL